jgi:hypothetical protein
MNVSRKLFLWWRKIFLFRCTVGNRGRPTSDSAPPRLLLQPRTSTSQTTAACTAEKLGTKVMPLEADLRDTKTIEV